MIQTDARKLSQDAQEALRMRAIKAVVKDGMGITTVAKTFDISRSSLSEWLARYRNGGESALKKKKRGRRSQDMKLLQPYQCAIIVNIIKDLYPDQLKLPFMLWTRDAVGMLIEQKFGIKMCVRTVGNYLKRWGFTPQKPLRRAYERQDKAVKVWLEETYPGIAARAKQENAEIHWGDESGFRSTHQTGTSYSPKGKTPVIKSTGKRFKVNMISTVTNKGTLRFMLFEKSFAADVFLNFLRRLTKGSKTKVFLILDNVPVHHAKIVKAWLDLNKEKIEVFFLPAYSPELNPDELLNQDVKSNAVGRKRAKNLTELKNNLASYLFGTQRNPDIVKSYFLKSEVAYAA